MVSWIESWRSRARVHAHRADVADPQGRDAFILASMRELIEASRTSTDAVVSRLAAATRARDAAIDAFLVFAPDGEDLSCIFADGPRADHFRHARLPRGQDHLLPSLAADSGHRVAACERLLMPNDRRGVAVPMLDRDGLHAVVYVSSSTAYAFADEETIVRTIEHATAPYALAVEREADRADATYDGLTGLLTARAFRTRLRDEITQSRLRAAPTFSLWFIDTDNFKSVNDGYGHAHGDRVLQAMATLLRAHTIDDIELAGRNGGDEFCALIVGGQKSAAIERAQAFCDAVRAYDFGIPMRVSASVGVASYPLDAQDANELLEVADAAMYHSKRGGRDRVSFALEDGGFSTFR